MATDETAPRQLLLYAKPGDIKISSISELTEPLIDIKFIGNSLQSTEIHHDYYAGDRLIDLINFLGCSPAIKIDPKEGADFCFVRLHELSVTCQCYSGVDTRSPYCRRCKQNRDDWKEACTDNYCEQCDAQDRMQEWKWRKTGALTRAAVSIMHVYPHEAVPAQQLLDSLSAASGVAWACAYL